MLRDLFRALLLGLFDRRVNIGINFGMDHSTAHGIIHSASDAGVTEHVNFLADRPRYLKRPTPEIIQSIFEQAKGLGLTPKQIEIRVGHMRRVYDERRGIAIFEQRLL